MLNVEELECIQEIINEEILSYLDSGYNIQDGYIILLRNILKKLNLKETYDFKKRYYIDNYISKDKIKAKIEYYEKIDNSVGKIVLQSLLKDEGE